MVDTDRGRVLTPHGRWQVVNGLARPVIKYGGDPDTRPITSREVVWIVRGLHQLSACLNGHYGLRVQSLYSEDSVRGQMARLVLAATVNYIMTKSLCGGPSTRDLPEVARGPDDPGLPPAVHRYHVADGPLRPRVSDHPPDPRDHGGLWPDRSPSPSHRSWTHLISSWTLPNPALKILLSHHFLLYV